MRWNTFGNRRKEGVKMAGNTSVVIWCFSVALLSIPIRMGSLFYFLYQFFSHQASILPFPLLQMRESRGMPLFLFIPALSCLVWLHSFFLLSVASISDFFFPNQNLLINPSNGFNVLIHRLICIVFISQFFAMVLASDRPSELRLYCRGHVGGVHVAAMVEV